MPNDEFDSFEQLARTYREGRDFTVRVVRRASPYAIVAPHGGKIEPGTSQLAKAVAGEEHSLYLFEGMKRDENGRLHITSDVFNEPRCLEIVRTATTVVTIHGMKSAMPEVQLGGLDESLMQRLEVELGTLAISIRRAIDPRIAGTRQNNLCNRGRSRRGCQLEISEGLRRRMFRDLTSSGLEQPREAFHEFVAAVRRSLRDADPGTAAR